MTRKWLGPCSYKAAIIRLGSTILPSKPEAARRASRRKSKHGWPREFSRLLDTLGAVPEARSKNVHAMRLRLDPAYRRRAS
jgi:hypothetical protein